MREKKKVETAPEEGEDTPKGGRKKLLVIGLVAVLALGAAAYFFVFSGGSAEAEPAPEAGSVLAVEPVAINLAGGSYLKLGFTLQYTVAFDEGGGHGAAVQDGSKALDIAISQFSGATLADVQNNREAMMATFTEAVVHAYHDEVMDVYLTEYVTQ